MSTREDLIAAKALIDTPEKWIKGEWEGAGCYCALGAVAHLYDPSKLEWRQENEDALNEAVPEPMRSIAYDSYQRPVVIFNDDDDTTHADIMALFDRAIAAAGDA